MKKLFLFFFTLLTLASFANSQPQFFMVDVSGTSGGGSPDVFGGLVMTRTVTNKDTVNYDLSGLISQGYTTFTIYFNVRPAVNTDTLRGRYSADGTTWITATNYVFHQNYAINGSNGSGWNGSGTSFFGLATNVSNGANDFARGRITLVDPNAGGTFGADYEITKVEYPTTRVTNIGGAYYNAASVIKGIQFYFGNGNIASGTFTILALKQ